MRSLTLVPIVSLLAAVAASPCADAATIRGSYDKPPYYDGKLKSAPAPGHRPAHVAVEFRIEPSSLDATPGTSPSLAALMDSLQLEIGRLGLTRPLAVDAQLAGRADVRFGVRRGGTDAKGVPRAATEIDPTEPRRMSFEVEGPSKGWKRDVGAAMGDSLSVVVSVQLGFDDFWVRQEDWKGTKTIAIGTERKIPIPWLTSLDDPVQVLQLTGAVVDRKGKVLRVGSEGLTARRTGMTASVIGVQEIITEEDLRVFMAPPSGVEPVWRTALRQLIENLLATKP